jgi:hypothetical protein
LLCRHQMLKFSRKEGLIFIKKISQRYLQAKRCKINL